MTHMCVAFTAQGAFNLGYRPTVVPTPPPPARSPHRTAPWSRRHPAARGADDGRRPVRRGGADGGRADGGRADRATGRTLTGGVAGALQGGVATAQPGRRHGTLPERRCRRRCQSGVAEACQSGAAAALPSGARRRARPALRGHCQSGVATALPDRRCDSAARALLPVLRNRQHGCLPVHDLVQARHRKRRRPPTRRPTRAPRRTAEDGEAGEVVGSQEPRLVRCEAGRPVSSRGPC